MIRSRAEYIRLMMLGPAQAGTTAHAKLLADTMALAERQLSKVTLLTQSEASRCHEEILKLQIPQGDQARLMAAVDAKVLNADMAIEKPKHRNYHGIKYFNAQEWVNILRLDVNPQLKMMIIANKIRKLCMHNADEKTFLYFAALATVKVAIADEAEALAYVNELKNSSASHRATSFPPLAIPQRIQPILRCHIRCYANMPSRSLRIIRCNRRSIRTSWQ